MTGEKSINMQLKNLGFVSLGGMQVSNHHMTFCEDSEEGKKFTFAIDNKGYIHVAKDYIDLTEYKFARDTSAIMVIAFALASRHLRGTVDEEKPDKLH